MLLPNLGGPFLAFRNHRIEFVMVQQLSGPQDLPTGFDQHVVLFPARYADYVPTGSLTQSDGSPAFGVLPTADGDKVIWAVR